MARFENYRLKNINKSASYDGLRRDSRPNVKTTWVCKRARTLSHWQKASSGALFIVVTGSYARNIERKRSVKMRTLTNKLLGIIHSMRYVFDILEAEILESGRVKVFRYGRKSGKEYTVSIKTKNWLEWFTSSKEVRDIPNIVLKRHFRGMKLVFTKAEANQYKFTLLSWFIPFGVGSKSMYYAAQPTVHGFTAKVDSLNA